jgi:hypothetical protein
VGSDDETVLRTADGRLRAWLRTTLAVLAFLVARALTGAVWMLFDSLAVAIAVGGLISGIVLVGLFVWFAPLGPTADPQLRAAVRSFLVARPAQQRVR